MYQSLVTGIAISQNILIEPYPWPHSAFIIPASQHAQHLSLLPCYFVVIDKQFFYIIISFLVCFIHKMKQAAFIVVEVVLRNHHTIYLACFGSIEKCALKTREGIFLQDD